jgi:nicotinate dehydrogenase subunit B
VTDPTRLSSAELLGLRDSLLVYRHGVADEQRAIEPFILIEGSSRIYAFNGHVDLGTGIRTALAQIVAEELDVGLDRVTMILGDTARTPDQGATIASDSIQVAAIPLRAAAAQARAHCVSLARIRLGVAADAILAVENGVFGAAGVSQTVSYGEIVRGRQDRLLLRLDAPVKPPSAYTLVGTSAGRLDLPAKVTGERVFVHDVRVPGMLHGRVVHPPYLGMDAGDFVGRSLIGVDHDSLAHIRGLVRIVVIGDFVGIVTEREEEAVAAARDLRVEWQAPPPLRELGDLATALRANPAVARRVQDKGDVERALQAAATRMSRTYVWPYQMHASIGPSCAVADYGAAGVTVWSGTQNPHTLRADLALLLDIPGTRIQIERMEAAGCYGRNCADDVAADAALLSRAVGRPVRVQLSREQEHLWEPKGAAQLMDIHGALDERGGAISYEFQTRYPSNGAPTLALLLTGKTPAVADVWQMGDRTSVAPYDFPNMRTTIYDMPPIVRASWLRGVSALPNVFAHESWIDEAAAMAGVDPVEYRLRYLTDPRGVAVIEATAERAGWSAHTQPQTLGGEGDVRRGRGFSYALYVHSKFPGSGAAWAAWVADVSVNVRTGEVSVSKVTVGHDAGLMINPAGVRHQIHGNVIQSTSRALKEQVTFSAKGVVPTEWGGYPILTFPELPSIDVLLVSRPDQPPRGAGEAASVPSAAAIANAIYDATGVRFREPPFTPEKVLAGLHEVYPSPQPTMPRQSRWQGIGSWKGIGSTLAAAGAGALVVALSAWPWRQEIRPIPRPDPSLYSTTTLERGRILAAAGDCAVCHTVPGGAYNAGGRRLETPFGALYTTNITPDVETGIGGWSYAAFERAMREGIHRDGRHLYPAFPYTAFAQTSDADLQALYAYLMSRAPVRAEIPPNTLPFPFSWRPLLAGWKALFHHATAPEYDTARSEAWNRGRYLAEGLGHCAACHSPRNLLGAEKSGPSHFSGGHVEGWDAPALTAANPGPLAWTENDIFDYLRTGRSLRHGVASGPMAEVVSQLRELPDSEIRAMAVYLGSFGSQTQESAPAPAVANIASHTVAVSLPASAASRMYDGACAACHELQHPSAEMDVVPLALSTKVNAPRADNFLRIVLDGWSGSHASNVTSMPGFRHSLSDSQIAELATYVRQRFAPDRPSWEDLGQTLERLRPAGGQHSAR